MSFRYTRPDSFPPIVKNLLFINGLFFLATHFLFRDIGLIVRFGLWPINSDYFRPYQLFTHMFTHADFGHILFNMFSLWMFGRVLESVWGSKKFLTFYLICGIGAAVTHLAVQYITGDEHFAVGASGAVMGVMVGFAYLFPNTELLLYFAIPVKAKWVIIALIAFDLFAGLGRTGTGIAHWAHLGGAATGFILVYIWNKTNKKTFY
jgi:membrane associated rhomboid family serine protease